MITYRKVLPRASSVTIQTIRYPRLLHIYVDTTPWKC